MHGIAIAAVVRSLRAFDSSWEILAKLRPPVVSDFSDRLNADLRDRDLSVSVFSFRGRSPKLPVGQTTSFDPLLFEGCASASHFLGALPVLQLLPEFRG